MENTSERKRKSKGSLSVLDEFTGDAGAILFAPNISKAEQQQIDKKTIQADAPAFIPPMVSPPEKTYGQPTEKSKTTYGKSTDDSYWKPTENLRTADGKENLRKPKPTDTPTEARRKMDGKPTEIGALVGFQRQAFHCLARQAKEFGFSDDSGNRITPPINGNVFAQKFLQKTYKQAKDVLYELKVAGLLSVYKLKNGRGGFVQFLILKSHYQEFLIGDDFAKPTDNILATYGKPTDKPTDTPTEALSSSSRDFYLNNSTTTQNVDNSESDAGALKDLDFSTVAEFGITSSTLSRCRELYPTVSSDQLGALTERFGQFMKTQDAKRVQNARGFFISLAEQLSKGVTPLDHIETREQALMREFVERAKEAKARRELLEKEAFEFAFEEWVESLDSKTRNELVPVNSVIESGSKIQNMKLKEHFRLSVWPTRFAVFKEPPGTEI